MPSAKNAFSFSSLRFSSGSTAMLFSGIAAACDWGGFVTTATGLVCRFSIPKYHPASAKNIRAATPAPSRTLLFGPVAETVVTGLICGEASCGRLRSLRGIFRQTRCNRFLPHRRNERGLDVELLASLRHRRSNSFVNLPINVPGIEWRLAGEQIVERRA